MRVFKTKVANRFFRREKIEDSQLLDAATALAKGLIDADLGGGLFKQRMARAGRGKRGGYRVLISFRSRDRAIFLFGFAKSERGNIDDEELTTLREISGAWLAASEQALAQAVIDKILFEVTNA